MSSWPLYTCMKQVRNGKHTWVILSGFSNNTLTSLSLMPQLSVFSLNFLQGTILEKLRICSTPAFLLCVQDLIIIKKDPNMLVTDTRFGTVPVRLFKPKKVSSKLRRGIIFYHGGGGIFGSLGKEFPCVVGRMALSKSRNLHIFSWGLFRMD